VIPASRQRNYLQSGLYVVIVAVLALILLERLLTYAEAYEKARMEMTVSRLQSGLYARLAHLTLSGDAAAAKALLAESPFAAIGWRPADYLGEFDGVPSGELEGRWYFDRLSGELVYRPNLQRYFLSPDPPAARFHVDIRRDASGTPTGVRLVPTEPIRWAPLQ
jgi:general secretion pathway protein G